MAKKIGFGIIGYGVIGPAHVKGIGDAPDAELRAICDIDPKREKVMREAGIDAPFYTDYKEMLRKEKDIKAVSICVPSGLHAEVGADVAASGRHVLSEKPLDITLANMDRLIDKCDKAKVKLGCIFQKRTYQTYRLARKAIGKNLLGPLVMADSVQKYYRSPAYYKTAGWRGTWELDGGGALMNQAVHGLDLLLWLMGDAESVFSYSDHLARDIEVEDTSISVVRFKNGALGSIIGTTSVVPGESPFTTIHGAKGTMHITDNELTCSVGKLVKGKHEVEPVDVAAKFGVTLDTSKNRSVASDHTNLSVTGHSLQVQDFCMAIRNNRKPMIDGVEARRSVELILAIYKSWKTGKEVKLPL